VNEVLTIVASLLIGHFTPVYCHAPEGMNWRTASGYTLFWPEPRIYVQRCNLVLQLNRTWVDVYAHEILHVEHPTWSEHRVAGHEHQYGAVVLGQLRPRLRR